MNDYTIDDVQRDYDAWQEDENINEAHSKDFLIDSDTKAEWALKKIKEAQDEHDRLLALVIEEEQLLQAKKEQIDKRLDSDTAYLRSLLMAYMEGVKCKETQTQKSYQLLTGKLIRKKGTIDFIRDEDKLLEWTKQNKPDLVKAKYSVDWSTLKKTLTVTPKGEVITDEGEMLDCITTEVKPDKFEIKF